MFPPDLPNESSSAPAKRKRKSRSTRPTPSWMTTTSSSTVSGSMSDAMDWEATAPSTTPGAMVLLSKDEYLEQLYAEPPIDRCPVCYESSSLSYTTSCEHIFCFSCMTKCAQSSHVCPMCRHVLYEAPLVTESDGEEEDESVIGFSDLDLEDDTDILEFPEMDTNLFYTHIDWLWNNTSPLGHHQRPVIRLDTLIHIQLCELLEPALAKIVFHRHKLSTLLPSEHEDFFCRPQWNVIAQAIYKVLKELDGRVVTSQKLLSSLTEEIETRLLVGDSDNDTWPQYIEPVETQRSFKNDVLMVFADLTQHAQIVWAARKDDLKRTSWAAWAFGLFGVDLDWCLNLEEKFLHWSGVRIKGHVHYIFAVEANSQEEEEEASDDSFFSIMEASRTLAANVHFDFGAGRPVLAATARGMEYEEDYDGDMD